MRDALKRLGIPKRSAVETRDLTLEDVNRWDGGGVQVRHPIGPTEHKAAAEELGLSTVDDLIVLSRHHDPFYCGTPAQIQGAEWFEALWKEHGSLGHLRRLHYRLVSGEERVTFYDDKAYLNDEYSFGRLCVIGCGARHLDKVTAADFVDRRNPDPVINVFQRVTDGQPDAWVDVTAVALRGALPWVPGPWSLNTKKFEIPEPTVIGYDYLQADQPILIEIWIEKTTMNDILEPLCKELGIHLVPASGMQSITSAVRLLQRCQELGKPGHVIYISDFDPAGENMPRAVARQLEFYREHHYPDVQVALDAVALTREQVVEWELPRIPIKESDKRAGQFEERYGEGAVELDALEALRPGAGSAS